MKVKHIIALFLVGVVLMIAGTFIKIMHWPGGAMILLFATIIKVIAGLLAIWKVLSMKKFKDFLNS